jgi:hypothetical protein
MRLPRNVKISIRPDGRVEVETHGFVGESCVDLSKALEQALAGDIGPDDDRVSRELRPEYYLRDLTNEAEVDDRTP